MKLEIDKLKLNDLHKKIYDVSDIDDLASSIEQAGQLEKVVINQDYVIISGVRRYTALKKLGVKTIEVEVKKISADEMPNILISYNKQRVKTNRELLNEAKYLKELWGKSRGRKKQTDNPSEKTEQKQTDTREKIAVKLGLSTGNLSKLQYIEKKDKDLISKIDEGALTINQAHNLIKGQEKRQKAINDDEINVPSIIDEDAYKVINKSSKSMEDVQDGSIQLVITSPPYWMKRTYTTDSTELGSEDTPEDFISNLVDHLSDVYRVLNDKGSFFLNLGDTYKDKCLLSIPHRVLLGLMEKQNWILRNTIIWKKKNPIPTSSKDNLNPSYEFIFHLVKRKDYYYKQTLIPCIQKPNEMKIAFVRHNNPTNRIPHTVIPYLTGRGEGKKMHDYWDNDVIKTAVANQNIAKKYSKNSVSHPAPYPREILYLPILQTTKPGDTVLDIFSGVGTTGEVALKLGRKYIGYDVNKNFIDIQSKHLKDTVNTIVSNN